MVDNVDKPLWISTTVFVHRSRFEPILTCGKRHSFSVVLQEILPEFGANLCSVANKNWVFAEIRRSERELNSDQPPC
jgi:hypothetical protein